jgi:hypothetical protein
VVAVSFDAESGTDGTTLTTANSGFDAVATAGGGAIFSSAAEAHGVLGYRFTESASHSNARIDTFQSVATRIRCSFAIRISAAPSAALQVSYWTDSGNTLLLPRIIINTNRTLGVQNAGSTTIFTGATALALNTWYRVELVWIPGTSTTTGTIGFGYALVDDPIDPGGSDYFYATNVNTGTNNGVGRWTLPKLSGTWTATVDVDDIRADDTTFTSSPTTWLGPATGIWGTTIGQLAGGTRTSHAVPVPSGVASGDIVLVHFYAESTTAVTPPAGFAELTFSPTPATTGTVTQQRVFWKRATGADSGTYTFTTGASVYSEATSSRYTGVQGTGTPVEVLASAQRSGTASTSSPSVTGTTSHNNELLVHGTTHWNVGAASAPTGFIELFDNASTLQGSTKPQATAGTTGAVVATTPSTTFATSTLVALSSNLSVGGPLDVTGSGTVAFTPTSVTAAGSLAQTGSGALTLTPTLIGGQGGTLARTGSGALSFGAGTPAPTGVLAQSGSGTLSLTPTAMTASGTLARTGTGTAIFANNIGAGTLTVTGSGALALASTLAVAGSLARTGSGALVFVGIPRATGVLARTGVGVLVMTPGAVTTRLKRWDGAAWVPVVVRKWDGSAWVLAAARVWNGTAWV